MKRPAAGWLLPAAALLLAGGGCASCPEEMLPVEQIISVYNANARAVPRLWARAEMSVTLAAPDGGQFTWQSGDPTCLLLLTNAAPPERPCDFVLIGRESAAVELFRLGSSTKQGVYYFWYRFGERGGAWFGRSELAGAPGAADLPLDPLQLLSVLAVRPLPADRTKLPAAVLTMQNTPGDCAYVLAVVDRQPLTGHVLLKREVFFRWAPDAPPRPYRVNILDAAGRRVLTARLGEYAPVDVSDLDEPPAVQPVVPTRIEILANPLPGRAATIRRIALRLSEMTAADKWDPAACAFEPPAGLVPVQVDRRTGPAEGRKGPDR